MTASRILKRWVDIVAACSLLVVASPLLAAFSLLIWAHDGGSPLYRQVRIGLGGRPFKLCKLRSMSQAQPGSTVDTTSRNDPRITPVGGFIRKTKIDELPQAWNVLVGDMSLVGPRPQVPREVALYTDVERGLLRVRPGITDFASIVFSDLGDIVALADDPDIAYNQLVRPGKSRLGLYYTANHSLFTDIAIMALTAVALINGPLARKGVASLLERKGADRELIILARRDLPLMPDIPPGGSAIVTSRSQPAQPGAGG